MEKSHSIGGISGRLWVIPGPTPELFSAQEWKSEPRAIRGYGKDARLQVKMRFDDECRNGHNTFSMTADVRIPGRRDIEAGGCLHDEIAAVFPVLSPLIKWHLVSSDGPMHYISNTVYHAGDRDHNGLRKGEKRVIRGPDKLPYWELVAITSGPKGEGIKISSTPTGREYAGADHVPLFILEKTHKGENPPATPMLQWVQSYRTGEGKARELDHARASAVWPNATDVELSVEPDELKAALIARHPGLMAEFRAAMDWSGFGWTPADIVPSFDVES